MNSPHPHVQSGQELLEKSPKTTGFTGKLEHARGAKIDRLRPAGTRWISGELLAETIALWAQTYKRQVSRDEAIEILMNVKAMAECLLDISKENPKS